MYMVKRGIGLLKDMYNQLNPATLTGAIDIVVVEQEDGTYLASPFHVRFGKLGVLRAKEKIVNITVNEERIHNLHMKLGDQGEAFFVQEIPPEEAIPPRLITSPIPSRPSTPVEEAGFEDDFNNQITQNSGFSGVGISTEKRKRRKKRKKRNAQSSTPDNSNEPYGSQSETNEDNKAFLPGKEVAENETEMNVSGPKPTEDFRPLPELQVTVYTSEESDTDFGPHNRWSRDTNESQVSLRGFGSDSEIPALEQENNCDIQPFSDSEATAVRHSQSSMKWGWGQLPGSNEAGQDSSSDDSSSSSSSSSSDGSHETTSSEDIKHFRTIPSRNESFEIVDEKNPSDNDGKDLQQTSATSKPTSRNVTKQGANGNGLYLDDVLNLAPSEANLYLQPTSKATSKDTASSDVTERAASPGCSDIDSGTDSQTHEDNSSESLDQLAPNVLISVCGFKTGTNDVDQDKFHEKLVSGETFSQNPVSILNDPNLVFKMDNRYMNWQTAAPAIVSLLVFRQPLTHQCIEGLVQSYQQPQQPNRLMGWFGGWRKPKQPLQADTSSTSGADPGLPSPGEVIPAVDDTMGHQALQKSYSEVPTASTKEAMRIRRCTDSAGPDTESEIVNILEPEMKRSQSAENVFSSGVTHDFLPPASLTALPGGKIMRKTTRLTSEQLESLSLQRGANKIVFSVTTQYQGTTRCQATVFLWKWSDKIVVSDIDGTITKSDVFGQILPVVGKDWTQSGVAQLYQNIGRNGYKFVYLSARAIGQASMTKDYLNWINQQGVSLPPGPLLLSPTSLMIAFRREVIEKKPEKFKIECLKDIKALFPSNPFSAGFGNKTSDVTAYTAVGIPSNRLFTINHRGELKHEELPTYTNSYSNLGVVVDNFFPPLGSNQQQKFLRAHEYSDFTYWRDDISSLADDIDQFLLA